MGRTTLQLLDAVRAQPGAIRQVFLRMPCGEPMLPQQFSTARDCHMRLKLLRVGSWAVVGSPRRLGGRQQPTTRLSVELTTSPHSEPPCSEIGGYRGRLWVSVASWSAETAS